MGTLNESQAAVLAALEPGGFLSVDQLSREADLTRWRTRAAISALSSRGLISPGAGGHSARYQITLRGRSVILARGRYFFPRPVTR